MDINLIDKSTVNINGVLAVILKSGPGFMVIETEEGDVVRLKQEGLGFTVA